MLETELKEPKVTGKRKWSTLRRNGPASMQKGRRYGMLSPNFKSDEVHCMACKRDFVDRYIARAQPFDKAGAYAIQGLGALLVRRIEGDYSNVVGLPLRLTARLLTAAGIDVL